MVTDLSIGCDMIWREGMQEDSIHTEFAEESIRNLLFLVKGLSELLLEHGFLDTEAFRNLMGKYLSKNANHSFVAIPMSCVRCNRKGFDRLGEDTKCAYCGGEMRFDLHAPNADEVLASVDVSKLFSFSVKPSDISKDVNFNYYAFGSVTSSDTYISQIQAERGYEEELFDKQKQNSIIVRSQDTVFNHQSVVNRLCHAMASIWEILSVDQPKMRILILRFFITIYQKKKQGLYDPSYSPVKCTKCQTEQWPSSVIFASCSVCSEPFPVKLLPGLLLMQEDSTDANVSMLTKCRKLENLYTLFEALFSCTSSAYAFTYEDLSKSILKICEPAGRSNEPRLCTACHRPISMTQFFDGQCPYCGKASGELFLDQFF